MLAVIFAPRTIWIKWNVCLHACIHAFFQYVSFPTPTDFCLSCLLACMYACCMPRLTAPQKEAFEKYWNGVVPVSTRVPQWVKTAMDEIASEQDKSIQEVFANALIPFVEKQGKRNPTEPTRRTSSKKKTQNPQ